MRDWLGNELSVGDFVVYTSKSQFVGMVLGELTYLNTDKIQIKPLKYSGNRKPTKIITLHSDQQAFHAVTRYYGELNAVQG